MSWWCDAAASALKAKGDTLGANYPALGRFSCIGVVGDAPWAMPGS